LALDAYNVTGVDEIWCEYYVFFGISTKKCICRGKKNIFILL